MEATRNDILLIANHVNQPFLFSREAVQRTAFLLLEAHKKAALRICATFKPQQITKEGLKSCFYGFFGELNQNHGLYPGYKLGFDATESQITKGIKKFLDTANYGTAGEARLKAFLLALLEGQEKYHSLIASLKSEEAHSFAVQAEKPIPNSNRRIDIFVGWNPLNSKKFQYGVLIEAKFKHKVTTYQLSSYKKHAKTIIGNVENTALLLLTLDGTPSHRNKDWQPMQWLTLMSRWERYLKDDDADFTQFRRFIWKKLGN